MYSYDHKQLNLPVHPGDTVFWVDEKAGWSVEETTAAAVVITEDQILLTRPEDPQPKEIGNFYFLTREDAVKYADEVRPEGPYVFGYETEKWIPADIFIPDFHGWKYIKTYDEDGDVIITSAYFDDGEGFVSANDGTEYVGFFDGEQYESEELEDVIAWTDFNNDWDALDDMEDYEWKH